MKKSILQLSHLPFPSYPVTLSVTFQIVMFECHQHVVKDVNLETISRGLAESLENTDRVEEMSRKNAVGISYFYSVDFTGISRIEINV